jgi:hypothetical protein
MAAMLCDTGTPVLFCAASASFVGRGATADHNDVEYSMRVSAISIRTMLNSL